MTDHTALIAELLEHAEWEEQRLNQACADVLRRAAEALEKAQMPKPHRGKRRVVVVPL